MSESAAFLKHDMIDGSIKSTLDEGKSLESHSNESLCFYHFGETNSAFPSNPPACTIVHEHIVN